MHLIAHGPAGLNVLFHVVQVNRTFVIGIRDQSLIFKVSVNEEKFATKVSIFVKTGPKML